MKIRELIKKNRSYRRFKEDYNISAETLEDLVELARFSASAANLQPLKYILVSTEEGREKVFPYTRWAGYLQGWNGPEEGERPSAYIIILGDEEIKESSGCDHGIAAQSILLGATEMGLGGCMIGAIDREGLRSELIIDSRYEILLIISLGKPAEEVVLEDAVNDNIRYYRDEKDIHHVPKRSLKELILDHI